jgi:hypothetical protein
MGTLPGQAPLAHPVIVLVTICLPLCFIATASTALFIRADGHAPWRDQQCCHQSILVTLNFYDLSVDDDRRAMLTGTSDTLVVARRRERRQVGQRIHRNTNAVGYGVVELARTVELKDGRTGTLPG